MRSAKFAGISVLAFTDAVSMRFCGLAALAVSGLLASSASAALLANGDFEANDQQAANTITNWSFVHGGTAPAEPTAAYGVQAGNAKAPVHGGISKAFIWNADAGSYIYQKASSVIEAGTTYTLSLWAADTDNFSGRIAGTPDTLAEWAIVKFIGGTPDLNMVYASSGVIETAATYTNYNVSYTSPATGGAVGEDFGVVLIKRSGNFIAGTEAWYDDKYSQPLMDDVSLSVPEPASLGLLSLGCLAMLRRRRA